MRLIDDQVDTIRQLALQVAGAQTRVRVFGSKLDVVYGGDVKPDGTPRKLMDVSRLGGAGWKAKMPFHQGLANAYADYRRQGDRTK